MIYRVRHRTIYKYAETVSYARCLLRLTPRASHTQTLLQSAIFVEPKPAERTVGVGAFGEQTLRVLIDTPHRKLLIDSRCLVDVEVPALADPSQTDAWETVRAAALKGASLHPDDPALYIYPTRRTPNVEAITRFARPSFSSGRPIAEAAWGLMGRIHAEFSYDADATTVRTPVQEAFEQRRGVCQDFAQIMICGLRGLGLPARYVSGYLRTIPPPGRDRLQGADATHAWVSVWCGDQTGWMGFDPTNDMPALSDHIVLAIGRDYDDVAPIEGVLLGPGRQTLDVEVDVAPEESPVLGAPEAQPQPG